MSVVREAESGRSLAGDDAVRGADYLVSCFGISAYSWLRGPQLVRSPSFAACGAASGPLAQDDDVEDEEGDPDLWHGNKRRALWETTCTRAALDPHSSFAERSLYAALAPSIQTSGILKSACRTWEDALWATISVLCEERQSEALVRLGGGSLGTLWERVG